MAQRISTAQAKAHLSDLLARVAYRGEHYVIERRGTPVAALVSIEDLKRVESESAGSARPAGALALVGAWSALEDAEIDTIVRDIYATREQDKGRPVELER